MQSKPSEISDGTARATRPCTWCEGSGTMYDTHCYHQTGGCPCDAYEMPCADCRGTGVVELSDYELSKARDLKSRLEQLARRAVVS